MPARRGWGGTEDSGVEGKGEGAAAEGGAAGGEAVATELELLDISQLLIDELDILFFEEEFGAGAAADVMAWEAAVAEASAAAAPASRGAGRRKKRGAPKLGRHGYGRRAAQRTRLGGEVTIAGKLAWLAYQRLSHVLARVRAYAPLGLPAASPAYRAFAEQVRAVYLPEWRAFFHGPGHRQPTGAIVCGGAYDGTPCTHGEGGRLCRWRRARPEEMWGLQLDHEHELALIVDTWARARAAAWAPGAPAPPWDAGVDAARLCHALFSVLPHARLGAPYVVPRCSHCHRSMPHNRERVDFVL